MFKFYKKSLIIIKKETIAQENINKLLKLFIFSWNNV